jgi:hypothetical protein
MCPSFKLKAVMPLRKSLKNVYCINVSKVYVNTEYVNRLHENVKCESFMPASAVDLVSFSDYLLDYQSPIQSLMTRYQALCDSKSMLVDNRQDQCDEVSR